MPTRRDFLIAGAGAALIAQAGLSSAKTMNPLPSFSSIARLPDVVLAFGVERHELKLSTDTVGQWVGEHTRLRLNPTPSGVSVKLQGRAKVSHIQLRWRQDFSHIERYLGDHWERSYGDLEWRGTVAGRPMPWYFMAYDGHRTHGYGVRTEPGAFCFWNADAEGVSLWLDVRSGGMPVDLGDRVLDVAEVISREGAYGESAFEATRAFCKQMCSAPRLADHPIYGTNDWNYAYGHNSAELIAGVSGLISELSPHQENRPYSVIDEGWGVGAFEGQFGHGPWVGNPRFGDMGAFASRLKKLGVRPGLWFRPLTPLPDTPASWRLTRDAAYLDPTIPEVKAHVATHIKRFKDWGYEMIKHDFTTWDLLGLWGFEMGASPTRDGWKLHDSSRTNAEVLSDLYRTIREAAGDVRLIGCNTVSHLAAGTHEVQRTGDDTSGRSWNRNRRMGVNTLAFRGAQHGAFYTVDPDIVAVTRAVPWRLVEQWLTLVSQSGAALFVAIEPGIVEATHRKALGQALAHASVAQPVGEPLDWMETDCPRVWRLRGQRHDFSWMGETGSWPFGD